MHPIYLLVRFTHVLCKMSRPIDSFPTRQVALRARYAILLRSYVLRRFVEMTMTRASNALRDMMLHGQWVGFWIPHVATDMLLGTRAVIVVG